jgi:hypothetical protein
MDPTISVHQILCKSRKECERDPGNNQTSIQRKKHEPYMESPNSPRLKKAEQVKIKVKRMFIIFFDINNSSWQTKQSIPHTTVTFTVTA